MATPPKLPTELVDQIIDHLHADVESLLSISLASRSCCTATRYHLFGTMLVSAAREQDAFQTFAYFLASSPSICVYVRSLTLFGRTPAPQPRELCSHIISTVVSLLPRLRVLELRDTRFACRCEEDFPLMARTSLETLIIYGAEVSTLKTILAVFSVFTEVRTLRIEYLQLFIKSDLQRMLPSDVEDALSSLSPSPWLSVSSLILQSYSDFSVIWVLCIILRTVLQFDALVSLEIAWPGERGLDAYTPLFQVASKHPRELIVGYYLSLPLGIAPLYPSEYQLHT